MADLTDLIAAHYPTYDARQVFDGCACGKSMFRKDHPAHVALVVEQHTNGRTAELEARVDEWSAEYRKGVQSRDDWRARAEKAEATIARVRNALPNIEGINPDSSHYDKGWDRGQQILTEHIQSAITGDYTRAALEGEQQ
ncbi:hypothetical protein [Rhodococcus sp. 008]|uniref:hypothetical protein n=1 Tax=Rhodococcus sp. 008 TaxID=1723645 RepID=UPI00080618E4|nr:hypothetical protein [Rhodococcus sp. 008]ANQ73196.1 hypothetical protein AOT96_21865 [Rhodococcus sp. 008]